MCNSFQTFAYMMSEAYKEKHLSSEADNGNADDMTFSENVDRQFWHDDHASQHPLTGTAMIGYCVCACDV